mmetsp:Transcript_885/g.2425  ORF Transcript_885/g.2425 Transcript_885/m.2425 type:complete len:246 (-) Transcript_885:474-1211(-)
MLGSSWSSTTGTTARRWHSTALSPGRTSTKPAGRCSRSSPAARATQWKRRGGGLQARSAPSSSRTLPSGVSRRPSTSCWTSWSRSSGFSSRMTTCSTRTFTCPASWHRCTSTRTAAGTTRGGSSRSRCRRRRACSRRCPWTCPCSPARSGARRAPAGCRGETRPAPAARPPPPPAPTAPAARRPRATTSLTWAAAWPPRDPAPSLAACASPANLPWADWAARTSSRWSSTLRPSPCSTSPMSESS